MFRLPLWIALAVNEFVGGRDAELHTGFVVQDGVVVRKNATFIYEVPPTLFDQTGYALIAASRSVSLMGDDYFLVDSEQLAEHCVMRCHPAWRLFVLSYGLGHVCARYSADRSSFFVDLRL